MNFMIKLLRLWLDFQNWMLNRILNKFANNFFYFHVSGPVYFHVSGLYLALEEYPMDRLVIYEPQSTPLDPFGTDSHMLNLRKV